MYRKRDRDVSGVFRRLAKHTLGYFAALITVGSVPAILSILAMTASPARAQSSTDPTPVPPAVMMVDNNKINIGTGRYEDQSDDKEAAIGDIHNSTFTSGQNNISDWYGTLSTQAIAGVSGSMVNGFLEMHIQWGMHYHNFLVGSTQTSNGQGALYRDAVMPGPYFEKGAGNATLACAGSSVTQLYGDGGICTVTESDGTQVNFLMGHARIDELNHIYPPGQIQSIVYPDGETITIGIQNGAIYGWSSRGVRYSSGVVPPIPPTIPGTYKIVPGTYSLVTDGYGVNTSVDYCDVAVASCIGGGNAIHTTRTVTITADSNSWVSLNSIASSINGSLVESIVPTDGLTLPPCGGVLCIPAYGQFNVVSPLGVTRSYTRTPASCSGSCARSEYATVSKQNSTTYQFYYDVNVDGPPPIKTIVNRPDGSASTYTFQNGRLTSASDGLNRTTTYQYFYGNNWGTTLGRPLISRIYAPNSPDANHGYTQYDYTHGALSMVTVVPIDGSPNLVTQYGITLTCNTTNYKICNKPQYVVDPKNNRTDYTYDPAHGGILTETGPADANGVRPQKRYTYAQLYPKVLNSSGTLVNSLPLWRLFRVSECRVATAANPASCVGTADEKVTTYAYNNNNVFLTSVTTAAGDGSNSATISYTYDYVGNVTSVKGPRTDVDDTRYATYDLRRRKVFEIGADPDGAGVLPRPIVRHVYDADSNEIRTEYGTGNATNGSDFVITNFKRMTYDAVTGLLTKTEGVLP